MAENQTDADGEQGDGETGKGSKKKKLLIIGAIVAVVLIAGGVTAMLLLGGGDEDAAQEHGSEQEHEAPPAPAIYESLGEKFVVTLDFEGKQRYMQLSVSAMTREVTVPEELKVHAPLIRSKLVSLFAAQDFAALRTEAGKLALREQVLVAVQEVLMAETGEPGVEQIFFTDFVLQ